jgi:PadR family transcriptional regulator, regulatory protein PadR
MTDVIRLSQRALRVLAHFLSHPTLSLSGAEIAKATGVGSGTLYPLLARLERVGWLTSNWESIDPRTAGRPRRRLYRLTGVGQRSAQQALSELQLGSEVAAWAT